MQVFEEIMEKCYNVRKIALFETRFKTNLFTNILNKRPDLTKKTFFIIFTCYIGNVDAHKIFTNHLYADYHVCFIIYTGNNDHKFCEF